MLIIIGADHPGYEGKMQSIPCSVIFHYIVPKDLVETPWVLLCSVGKHTHPPPPPNTLPQAYLNMVMGLIGQCHDAALTPGMYYYNHMMILS